MTTKQFIAMIGEAETGGIATKRDRLKAIGDRGLAAGYFQQHWNWRCDYWADWMWETLRLMDAMAITYFLSRHAGISARLLAGYYNIGHSAPDPSYDARCLTALAKLGIAAGEYDDPVEDV